MKILWFIGFLRSKFVNFLVFSVKMFQFLCVHSHTLNVMGLRIRYTKRDPHPYQIQPMYTVYGCLYLLGEGGKGKERKIMSKIGDVCTLGT